MTRLAVGPVGWEHFVFWLAVLLGLLAVGAAVTAEADDIKDGIGGGAIAVLSTYFMVSSWRQLRHRRSSQDRAMLLMGEVLTVSGVAASVIFTIRALV